MELSSVANAVEQTTVVLRRTADLLKQSFMFVDDRLGATVFMVLLEHHCMREYAWCSHGNREEQIIRA